MSQPYLHISFATTILLAFVVQRPLLQEQIAAIAVDNKVILTQTSCGYLEFAINWITHVEDMGIHNWLTIVEDETSLRCITLHSSLFIFTASSIPELALD